MSNTERFSAEIVVNSKEAQKHLDLLIKDQERLQKLHKEYSEKGMREQTLKIGKELEEIGKAIKKEEDYVRGLKNSVRDLSTLTYRELSATLKALNKELRSNRIEIGSAEWETITKKIRECKEEMQKFNEATQLTAKNGNILKRGWEWLNENWGATTQFMEAATGLSATIRKTTEDYAAMEQEMANVRKYTGQTEEEVKAMNEDFKRMDTRTARDELNQLAGAAGRLGITATKDIEEFVDAADKIGVALGDDLGKDAVDTIGKLAIAFGESDRLGLRGAMLASGSALNEIVQNSSAQAQPVVEFTKALSGVGQQAHMTQAQIMGFASALDQNNQEMATSSTVMSQLITKMYQDPAKFASMAGLEVKKFSELVKKDMNGALLQWFQATNKLGDMSVLAGAFDQLGMDGTRAVGVLATLAGHIDQVTEAQNIATKAYEKGTSVIEEFNVQNTTIQAGMDKAKKEFKEVSIELGEKLLPIVQFTISKGSMLVKVLSTTADFTISNAKAIITLTAALGAYLVAAKADLVMTKTITAIKRAYGTVVTWLTVQSKAYTTAMVLEKDAVVGCAVAQKNLSQIIVSNNALIKIAIGISSLMRAAYYALTLQFTAASRALGVFNLLLKANPWGAAATFIIGAVAAVYAFTEGMKSNSKEAEENAKKMKEMTEAQKQVNEVKEAANESLAREKTRIDALNRIIKDNTKSLKDRKDAIENLKKIVPGYHATISNEGKLINENTGSLKKYIKHLKAAAVAQAAYEKIVKLNGQLMDANDKVERKRFNVRAVNREIERGTKTGEYKTETRSVQRLDGSGGKTSYQVDNQKLAAKKEELHIQEEAAKAAEDEYNAIQRQIDAVMKFVGSSKEYKEVFDNMSNKGNDESPTTTTTTNYKSDKELRKEEAERRKKEAEERKELNERVDTAKASYQEQLAAEMLSYREGVTTYSDYMEKKHNLTQQYYDSLKAIYGEDSNEYKKLLDNREQEEMDYYQWKAKLDDDQIIIERMQREHSYQMQFLDKTNKEAYQNEELLNENLFQSDILYMRQKQNLYNRGSKEWEEWEVKIKEEELKHMIELEESYAKRLADYRREFSLMSAKELQDIELRGIESLYKTLRAEGKMTEDEYQRIVQGIKQSYAELDAEQTADSNIKTKGSKALDTARKKTGATDNGASSDIASAIGNVMNAVEQQKMVNDQLKELYEQGAIDYATYEEAKRQNARETAEVMMAAATTALGQINQMLGSVSSYMQACSDLETAKITRNYDAQIEAAGKNSKKREKLEKKRDEEIRKAKTKANRKAMAIEMAQAVASTAMAAINAYASASKVAWVLGPIAASLATAAGMLQIATIKKQHQAEEAGYYSGGFTGGKRYKKEAGVVHEGEFVANHQAVNNPQLTPLFSLIDTAQKNNRISSLTSQDVTNVMGGPASAAIVPIVNIQNDNSEIRENLDAVSDAVTMLTDTLLEPIEAHISMQELDRNYKRYKNLLNSK